MLGDPPKVTQFVTDRGALRLGLVTLSLAVCPASLPKAHLSKTPSALDKSRYVSPVQGHVSLGTSGHFVLLSSSLGSGVPSCREAVSIHPDLGLAVLCGARNPGP